MATKISALPAAAPLTIAAIFPVVQGGATLQATISQLLALVPAAAAVVNYIPVVAECITDQAPIISGAAVAVTGITTGSAVISSAGFVGVRLRIVRGNIPLPSIDPQDGGSFFTKNLADGFCTLNTALAPGEYIRIETVKSS